MSLITEGLGEGTGLITKGLGFLKRIIKEIVERITGFIPRIRRGVPFKIKFSYFGKGEKSFFESKETRGMVSSPFSSIKKVVGKTGLSFKHSLPIVGKIDKRFLSSIKYSGKIIQGLHQSIVVKGKKSFERLNKLLDFLFEEELEDTES